MIRSRRGLLLALVSVALGAAPPVLGETLAERAFEKLRAHPPLYPGQFDFVVASGICSGKPAALPPEFFQMIREWNVLEPVFVVNNRAFIVDGAPERGDEQWMEFERAAGLCEAPLFPIAGNHDVSEPAIEQVYESRIGPLTYSFSYGNSRFIALNTEEQGGADRLSSAQVAWLKEDLEHTKANNIFLFLHRPFFAGDWDATWSNVAEVLQGHPVRIVFAGHDHGYQYWGERDGVRYVISGGAERGAPEKEAGFVHYLLVRVRGVEVDWAVIRPGSVLPPDVITKAALEEKQAFEQAFRCEPVEIPYGESVDRIVNVTIENPSPETMSSTLTWHVSPDWRVDPLETPFTALPSQPVTLAFRVWTDSPETVRFPAPAFRATVPIAQSDVPVTITKNLDLIPTTVSPFAEDPVFLDGVLTEWARATPIPLAYACGFLISDVTDLQSQIRLLWDEGHVYIAVETEDDEFYQPHTGDAARSADNVQVFLDDWAWSLTLTERGEEVFLHKGPKREGGAVNTAVRLAVKRNGRRTVFEAAFPVSEVAPVRLAEGNSYRLSVVANDLDPGVPGRPRHWAELTPGWGDAGRGPMIKVILGPIPKAPESVPPPAPAESSPPVSPELVGPSDAAATTSPAAPALLDPASAEPAPHDDAGNAGEAAADVQL